MIDPGKLVTVSSILKVEDFYSDKHRRLYELMLEMSEQGEVVEMLAVVERIIRSGAGERMGGLDYVTQISDHVPSTENIEHYANVVADRASDRRLLAVAKGIIADVESGKASADQNLESAQSAVFALAGRASSAGVVHVSEVVDSEIKRLQELSTRGGAVSGTSTGFVDLDKVLAGLHPSDLIILAARPAMGKTALALNIAANVASTGAGALIFSLEMSKGQLVTRLLCSEARVDAGRMRTGSLSRDQDWPAITQAAEFVHQLPIFVDDTPGVTITQLRNKARTELAKNPHIKLIVVDYIGLMGGEDGVPREQQIAACSRGLKLVAKELNVTIIALSQLNRGVESRNPKIPQLSDLRDSGAIEQDADVILFIYRDEYYNKDSPRIGEADIIVAKQRNGPTGEVPVAFDGRFTRFDNLESRHNGYAN